MDKTLLTVRGAIKHEFITKTKEQLFNYIKDLEDSVLINKEVIQDLIGTAQMEQKYKTIIQKLNKETATLSKKYKLTVEERDGAQYKALISLQLIEDLKEKEREIYEESQEKVNELKDQLSRKEYTLQYMEKKYYEAEKLLKKYARTDGDIKKLMESRINKDTMHITNVVAENEILKSELNKLKIEKDILLKEIDRLNSTVKAATPFKQVPKLALSTIRKNYDEEYYTVEGRNCSPQQEMIRALFATAKEGANSPAFECKANEENQGALNKSKSKENKSFAEISSISNYNENSLNNSINNNIKVEIEPDRIGGRV